MAHVKLGPSNHRWPHCPGSVREEAKYPYQGTSEAAIDGTGSHELLELCLKNNVAANHYDQTIIGANHHDQPNGWLVGIERINRVQICLDYVNRRIDELVQQFPGCDVIVESESKSNPGMFFGRTDWWGTVDITITAKEDDKILFVEVVDYKDGRGYVTEKLNTQLISYIYGKIASYIKTDAVPYFTPESGFRMTIVQPKTNTPIRYMCSNNPDHGIGILTLCCEAVKLANAADATDATDAALIAGKHCQWCKANPNRGGHCTTAIDKSIGIMNMDKQLVTTNDTDLVSLITNAVADVKSLTTEQLSMIADAEDGFSAAFSKVRSEIIERLESGDSVVGYALLPGRCSNVWAKGEDEVAKILKAKRLKKDEIFPPKLISPAQVLKLASLTDKQKDSIKEELITEMAGKLTLKKVAHDFKVKKVEEMFANIEPISFL